MQVRKAHISDIPQIQIVRSSVKENVLSDPSKVTDLDVEEYITKRGRGWVCQTESRIAGFAIVDLQENNVWALFVHPEFEGQGIGRQLMDTLLDWYFKKNETTLWLSTEPGTRAERFYTARAGIERELPKTANCASKWRIRIGAVS